jgi:hypothetical protein
MRYMLLVGVGRISYPDIYRFPTREEAKLWCEIFEARGYVASFEKIKFIG